MTFRSYYSVSSKESDSDIGHCRGYGRNISPAQSTLAAAKIDLKGKGKAKENLEYDVYRDISLGDVYSGESSEQGAGPYQLGNVNTLVCPTFMNAVGKIHSFMPSASIESQERDTQAAKRGRAAPMNLGESDAESVVSIKSGLCSPEEDRDDEILEVAEEEEEEEFQDLEADIKLAKISAELEDEFDAMSVMLTRISTNDDAVRRSAGAALQQHSRNIAAMFGDDIPSLIEKSACLAKEIATLSRKYRYQSFEKETIRKQRNRAVEARCQLETIHKQALDAYKAGSAQYKVDRDDFQRRIQCLQEIHSNLRKEITRWKTQNDQHLAGAKELEAKKREQAGTIFRVRGVNSRLERELESVTASNRSLRQENARLLKLHEEALELSKTRHCDAELTRFQQAKDGLEREESLLAAEREREAEPKALLSKLTASEENKAVLERQVTALRTAADAHNRHVQALVLNVSRKDETIERLKYKLTRQEVLLAELEAIRGSLATRGCVGRSISRLIEQRQALLEQIRSLTEKVDQGKEHERSVKILQTKLLQSMDFNARLVKLREAHTIRIIELERDAEVAEDFHRRTHDAARAYRHWEQAVGQMEQHKTAARCLQDLGDAHQQPALLARAALQPSQETGSSHETRIRGLRLLLDQTGEAPPPARHPLV
ncbi:unnamed protein product [Diplocarpon coronariae]|nr:hypothetical protein JHW43_009417 [Diplocarpon mali]